MKKFNFAVIESTGERYFDGSLIKKVVGEVHTDSEKYLHIRLNELIGIGYTNSINRYAVDLDLVDD